MPAQVLIAGAGVAALEAALALRSLAAESDGALLLNREREIDADCVVAAPHLRGPSLEGIPQTPGGFIAVDDYAHVAGCEDV